MLGGGHYEDACTVARESPRARGAILIIIGGEDGSGFSCQCDSETLMRLPEILETMARQLRTDRKKVVS